MNLLSFSVFYDSGFTGALALVPHCWIINTVVKFILLLGNVLALRRAFSFGGIKADSTTALLKSLIELFSFFAL